MTERGKVGVVPSFCFLRGFYYFSHVAQVTEYVNALAAGKRVPSSLSSEYKELVLPDFQEVPRRMSCTDVLEIASGGSFGAFVESKGRVFVFGYPELHKAVSANSSYSSDQAVKLDEGVDHVACGLFHCCAWNGSSVFTWGYNINPSHLGNAEGSSVPFGAVCGQLGRGVQHAEKYLAPDKVTMPDGSGGVLHAACGASFTLVACDGGLYGFGLNREHQISTDKVDMIPSPMRIPTGNQQIVRVACGAHHALAVTSAGNVLAWGWNEMGQAIGVNRPNLVTEPTQVSIPEKVSSVSGGLYHSLALSDHGTAYSWGQSSAGQLGRKDGGKSWRVEIPEMLVSVSCGLMWSSAVSSSGQLWVWGVLQDTTHTAVQQLPRVISAPFFFTSVSAGAFHSICTGLVDETFRNLLRDIYTKVQDADGGKQLLSFLDSNGGIPPPYFTGQQNNVHQGLRANKVGCAVQCLSTAEISWYPSTEATTFDIPFEPMSSKSSILEGVFTPTEKMSGRITVTVEPLTLSKSPKALHIVCSAANRITDLAVGTILGVITVSLQYEKDRKKKAPSSSFFILVRCGNTRSRSNSATEPLSARRDADSINATNPLLGLVHANTGRAIVRKCELDSNLEFPELIESLIKYPDRAQDVIAFCNTIPMWSKAADVLSFMLEDKVCLKRKEKAVKFLNYIARVTPWTRKEEEQLRELGAKIETVYGTNSILQATEGNTLVKKFRDVLKLGDAELSGAVVSRATLVLFVSKSGEAKPEAVLDQFVLEGFIVERHDLCIITKRGRRVSTGRDPIPVNRDYVRFLHDMTSGFHSLSFSDMSEPDGTHLRVFPVYEAQKRGMVSEDAALGTLQALVDQGVLSFYIWKDMAAANSIINTDTKLYVTRFGLKMVNEVMAEQLSQSVASGGSSSSPFETLKFKKNTSRGSTRFSGPPISLIPSSGFTFESLEVKEAARQTSIIFQDLYRQILPSHLLETNPTMENPAVRLFEMIKHLSNQCAVRLLRCSLEGLVPMYSRLLHYGEEMLELKNYSGAFAVALGTSMHCVSRLNVELPAKDEVIRKRLADFVDAAKNNSVYRTTLAAVEASESCVPYLGLLMQSIILIQEGNMTKLEKPGSTTTKVINREKVLLMWNVMASFFTWQKPVYWLTEVKEIREYLEKMLFDEAMVDEDMLYEMSYKLKPLNNDNNAL